MKYLKFLLLGCLALILAPVALRGAGTVYLVVGSDTAVWNVPGGIDVTKYHGHFVPDVYTLPEGNGYQVMNPAFRNRFVDSYGQRLKLTWWMMVGSAYLQCVSTYVPIPNLLPLYLMTKYHGDAMAQYGDEISIHYHTFFWSDYDGDGIYYWNQSRTFHEAREDFNLALAQALVEHGVFPVSFRSGWHYMDNEWQAYINQLLPFSMHNASPNVHVDNVEPYDNVYDWSKAPITFVPFHPSTTNYQIPGDGIGWNVRSVKMPSVSQTMVNQMFAQAAAGTNQVACFWAHLPESDYLTNVARIDSFAQLAASNNPTVKFRYCTAVEAMQRWLGTTDETPPQLDVSEETQGETVRLTITSSEPIWQPQPFVALKDRCEQYRLVRCDSISPTNWTAVLPVARGALARVAIAVTDLAGNVSTRTLSYVPDDLYLDNLDPQYSEITGNWTQNTNWSWGADSRSALLSDNDSAQAQWLLPITASGFYALSVQVPAITNGAETVLFNAVSGSSNALSVLFTNALPPKQWIYLGAPWFDASLSNFVTMTVTGTAGSFAVADVLKVSPLVAQTSSVEDVRVDVSDTTANIRWSTATPDYSRIEYGPDISYGRFSVTNSVAVTNHVMTLSGLSPNTTYYFQINASGAACPAQYSFTTTNFITTAFLFDVTKMWKYSTNELDGIDWQSPSYNDSAWSLGPGLLWIDTRSGTLPPIQPKGTRLPANSATGVPFVTYYFRTHFNVGPVGPDPAGTSLVFSNYVDDGAVFYLNGTEIYRLNMPAAPTVISNTTLATGVTCSGDATCPVIFTVAGDVLTNLVAGDNVLGVEVHNNTARSSDITFGSALRYMHPKPPLPRLELLRSADVLTLYWNEEGFILQEADDLTSPASWRDTPGPITASPYSPAISQARFFRLRGQ